MRNTIYFNANDGESFTSYKFYNYLLDQLYDFYHSEEYTGEPPSFSFERPCYIDPVTLPLITGLGLYLKNFHDEIIKLRLSNTPETIKIIRFLDKSDFFHLVGDNVNDYFPIGKNIYSFNKNAIGGYSGYIDKEQREEHKIRGYTKEDKEIKEIINLSLNSEDLRDNLLEYFKFLIPKQFGVLLKDKAITQDKFDDFVEILSELITNSLIHSNSDCYALMHTNKYRTASSIVDIGIGFFKSFEKKSNYKFYKKFQLLNELKKLEVIDLTEDNENNLFSIFEALYFSMLRHRRGLFDLLIMITHLTEGTMRIHNSSAQIIISSRFYYHLKKLYPLREKIYGLHKLFEAKKIKTEDFNFQLMILSKEGFKIFVAFAKSVFSKYSENIQFSSIRINDVELDGVHIEIEIPNEEENSKI